MYRVPWRYHNIREGGVRMSGNDTVTGVNVRNLDGGKLPCFLRLIFLSAFRHENKHALATDLHYLMYIEGRVIWKQIIQKNEEQ
jgi:hypothetical protein